MNSDYIEDMSTEKIKKVITEFKREAIHKIMQVSCKE